MEPGSQYILQRIIAFVRHRYDDLIRLYVVLNKQVEPVRVEANILIDSKGELAQASLLRTYPSKLSSGRPRPSRSKASYDISSNRSAP
jgi:hypothetical protein